MSAATVSPVEACEIARSITEAADAAESVQS